MVNEELLFHGLQRSVVADADAMTVASGSRYAEHVSSEKACASNFMMFDR